MTRDDVRANFLSALDRANLDVTDWEASFLDSCLGRFNFSPRQQVAIDKMMTKYEDKIGFNAEKGPTLAARAAIEETKLKRDVSRCRAMATANSVAEEPSMAVKLYLEAPRHKREEMWKYLLESERQALIKAGKK